MHRIFRMVSVIFASVSIFVILIGVIEAATIQYKDHDTGSAQSSAVDQNQDNFPAVFGFGTGNSNSGPTQHHWVAEAQPLPERNRCPEGTRLEARFIRVSELRQFQSGNQLYSEGNPDDAGFICVLEDRTYSGVYYEVITGGTGRFEGATGKLTVKFTGKSIGGPRSPKAYFGPITYEAEGTIELP